MSLLDRMRELKLRAERKKENRRKNTRIWCNYLSKRPPWNQHLMQHVIHHFGVGSIEGIKFDECEEHDWRKIDKDKYAKAEPFIYPEDVDSTYQKFTSPAVAQSHTSPKLSVCSKKRGDLRV